MCECKQVNLYSCTGSCNLSCKCTTFVIGWAFITILKYLVSQNESDGGDWEGKASASLSCFVCCSLHLLSVVATYCAVCSPLPFSFMFLTCIYLTFDFCNFIIRLNFVSDIWKFYISVAAEKSVLCCIPQNYFTQFRSK